MWAKESEVGPEMFEVGQPAKARNLTTSIDGMKWPYQCASQSL